MSRNLVIYFSRPGLNFVSGDVRFLDKGNTETAVEHVLNVIDADVFRIETVTPYSEDYYECTNEAKAEKKRQKEEAKAEKKRLKEEAKAEKERLKAEKKRQEAAAKAEKE